MILPIRINFSSYLETNVIEKNYTLDNVVDDAFVIATTKLNNKIGSDSEIVGKKF